MGFNSLNFQNLAEFISVVFAVRGLGPGYLDLLRGHYRGTALDRER
jgi:hypothetical protein